MNNFLEFLRTHLNDQVAEQIGAQVGLSPSEAKNAFQAVLPLQLDALTSHAQTQSGAQQLLDLAASVPGGSLSELLSRPGAFADLAKMGNTFAPLLLGNAEQIIASKVNEVVGVPAAAVQNMGRLTLPAVLSLLAQHVRNANITPAQLGNLLLGMRPELKNLLSGTLGGLLGGLSVPALATSLPTEQPEPDAVVSAEPTVRITDGPSLKAEPAPAPTPAPAAPVPERTLTAAPRSSFPWWLLIPLIILLALLLRYCAQQANTNQPQATPPAQTQTQPQETAPADAGSVVVETPQSGATLPPQPFTMTGKGKAGDNLSISDEGQEVQKVTVGADGNWSADLPAPTVGEHTYTVQGSDSNSKAEFKLNVADGASGANNGGAANANNASAATNAASTAENANAAGTLAITEPKDGASTPSGKFALKGTGKAGDNLEVFEDGSSIGHAMVGSDGTWTLEVPSPAAGSHKYEVKGPETSVSSTIEVGKGEARASGQTCNKNFTLSLKDGDTVTAPFRFGGEGKGQGYVVTVERLGRVIGVKKLPLDANCGYSYGSHPGRPGDVKYTVKDQSGAVMSSITLHVK